MKKKISTKPPRSQAGFRTRPDPNVTWTSANIDDLDLAGIRAIVVGGTGGLGRAISTALAARGASVTVVGREFRDAGVKGIDFVKADLSLLSEAERIAKTLPFEESGLLVLTTGIFAGPKRQVTSEGFEIDMAVSFLNRLVLLRGAIARFGVRRPDKTIKPRIFVMGFPGTGQTVNLEDLNAEAAYDSMKVHVGTVAGNEALVVDAVSRYPGVNSYGLNPGLVKTNIRSNIYKGAVQRRLVEGILGLVTPNAATYAKRIVPLLVSRDIENNSGAMFGSRGAAIMPSESMTPKRAAEVIRASEALVQRLAPEIGL